MDGPPDYRTKSIPNFVPGKRTHRGRESVDKVYIRSKRLGTPGTKSPENIRNVRNDVLFEADKFGKPTLGPKESQGERRDFSEEQLRAGEGIIGLQAGTNKGANASGINMGNTRHI